MDYLQRLLTQNFYVYGARKLYALINQDHPWPYMVKGLWLAAPPSD